MKRGKKDKTDVTSDLEQSVRQSEERLNKKSKRRKTAVATILLRILFNTVAVRAAIKGAAQQEEAKEIQL